MLPLSPPGTVPNIAGWDHGNKPHLCGARLWGFCSLGAAEHRRRSTFAIAVVPAPVSCPPRRVRVRYNFRVAGTRFIGVDLAWREGSADLVANETGVAVIDGDGKILDAG